MKRKLFIFAWILVAPLILIRLLTVLYPMMMTFYYSLLDYSLIRGEKKFIGLGNFSSMWSDGSFMGSLNFTFIFTVISVLLHVILGVALGLLLNVKFKGRKLLRSIVLLPWAIPLIVMGVAARFMFDARYGLVDDILFRLIHIRPDWLVTIQGSRIAVIATDVWKSTPFFAILVLAGLQTIPDEIYEAAKIDGANKWRIFWNITIPQISRLLIVLTIFFTLWRITTFDLVYALTAGGPGSTTSLFSYVIYTDAFQSLNFGYASSISVVLFMIMILVAGTGLFLVRKKGDA